MITSILQQMTSRIAHMFPLKLLHIRYSEDAVTNTWLGPHCTHMTTILGTRDYALHVSQNSQQNGTLLAYMKKILKASN